MMKISCLLLAAGKSSRMQGPNKLLLSINGLSLVRRTALEISKIQFQQVIAVTGFESEKVTQELSNLPLHLAYNTNHLSGMHGSIRTGLQHLTSPYDGFFVCLSDQPGFDHHVLDKMIQTFTETKGEKIIYPSFAGERGQPVLIPHCFVSEILSHSDGDHGCAYLFKKYPEHSHPVVLDKVTSLLDVDTPEDFSSILVQQYG